MNSYVCIARVVRISLIVVLVWLPSANASQTQDEMNKHACTEQKEAEQQLNKIYADILSKYHADKTFIHNMKNAQRAWLSYREAQVKSLYPHKNSAKYGTVYPMCRCHSLAEITTNRIKELEQWTQGIEVGDVCIGSRGVKL
jgi:uncharacterized protein YecT (DUF1311 family)